MGYRIDVKTIRRDAKPQPHYEVHIPAESFDRQTQVDWYFFADVNEDGSLVTPLGLIHREDFSAVKKLKEKGTLKFRNKDREVLWTEDNYVVRISDLSPLSDDFIEKWNRLYKKAHS